MMTVHPITLNVPDSLYRRIRQRAQETKRSVEDELLDVLVTAVPLNEELPGDLAEAVAALSLLDDAALWRVARSHLSPEISIELESLNWKQQAETLSPDEKNRQEALIRQYEKVMLTRARAAVLLKERGYDHGVLIIVIAAFIEPPLVLAGSRLTAAFRNNPRIGLWMDRALGVLFISLGVHLAASK